MRLLLASENGQDLGFQVGIARLDGSLDDFLKARHLRIEVGSQVGTDGGGLLSHKRPHLTRQAGVVLLDEHLRRLRESCKMYRIAVPFSDAELAAACKATVRANELGSCYVRPMVLVGYGAMGLDGAGSPIECYVPAWEWGGYLGDDSVFEAGIDCCTASWARAARCATARIARVRRRYDRPFPVVEVRFGRPNNPREAHPRGRAGGIRA